MSTFGRPCPSGEIAQLLPKPVTIYDPVVRLKADMSDERTSQYRVPPHFTNIQHGLQLARQLLATQDTLNRQIILITDGLPTAHFEGPWLYLLYPPDLRTETATLHEGLLCQREGITINVFLLPSWSQTEEDVRFAHRLAESTTGRVFFTAGRDLDRYVVWDYVARRREVVGSVTLSCVALARLRVFRKTVAAPVALCHWSVSQKRVSRVRKFRALSLKSGCQGRSEMVTITRMGNRCLPNGCPPNIPNGCLRSRGLRNRGLRNRWQ